MGVQPEVLWAEFAGGVASVGHLLLVLAFDNPVPLTRAWSIVEIVAGVGEVKPDLLHSKGPMGRADDLKKVEVIMPPAEEARFLDALVRDFDAIVHRVCAVDLRAARAWHGVECLVGGAESARRRQAALLLL